MLSAGLALAAFQLAGTAKPIKPIKVDPRSVSTDDVPGSFYVLFGGAAVGYGFNDADPSTVNLAQMDRTLKDASGIKVLISGYVSLGGLGMNSVDDAGKTMSTRLDLWRAFYQERTKAPLRLVLGSEAIGKDGQYDQAAVEAWKKWTGLDSNYAVAQGKDRIVVIDGNVTGTNVTWLQQEIAKDEADKSVERVFVYGALPLRAPSTSTLEGAAKTYAERVDAIKARKALASSKKVVAYFCGTPATFDVTPLETGSTVNQVVVGNAGSPLDPSSKSFGFTVLILYASGTVSVVPFNRAPPPVDQPFYSDSPTPPAAAVGSVETLLWSKKTTKTN